MKTTIIIPFGILQNKIKHSKTYTKWASFSRIHYRCTAYTVMNILIMSMTGVEKAVAAQGFDLRGA